MNKNTWSYYNPVKIFFGRGYRKILLEENLGELLLIITSIRGKEQFENDLFLKIILGKTKIIWITEVETNPCIDSIQKLIDQIKQLGISSIIAFGGGSALDVAKSLFWGLQFKRESESLRIMVNKAYHERSSTGIKFFAIPTTAGTGSEVTPFATIWDKENKKKFSLNGSALWPDVAIIDPDLQDTLPFDQTLFTGLDAINQAAESFWNKNANPITLSYSIEALSLGLISLPKLANNKFSLIDRDNMALCSLMAGMAISHTRTALCHSISYPLTSYFGVPHGLACAFTMTEVLRFNIDADDGRFETIKKVIPGNLVEYFHNLDTIFNIKERVKLYIPSLISLSNIYHEMNNISRSNNNLKSVELEDIKTIVKKSWNN